MNRRNFLKNTGWSLIGLAAVSYTHLDVYKRQLLKYLVAALPVLY